MMRAIFLLHLNKGKVEHWWDPAAGRPKVDKRETIDEPAEAFEQALVGYDPRILSHTGMHLPFEPGIYEWDPKMTMEIPPRAEGHSPTYSVGAWIRRDPGCPRPRTRPPLTEAHEKAISDLGLARRVVDALTRALWPWAPPVGPASIVGHEEVLVAKGVLEAALAWSRTGKFDPEALDIRRIASDERALAANRLHKALTSLESVYPLCWDLLNALGAASGEGEDAENAIVAQIDKAVAALRSCLPADTRIRLPKPTPLASNINLCKRLDEIELSVRAANFLQNAGIEYIYQLATKTEVDILRIRNSGRKSLNEVKEVLAALGLSLGMALPDDFVPPTPVSP